MSEGTIKVEIGTVQGSSGGLTRDTRRTVEFIGEELGTYSEPGEGRDGGITDTRGRVETLYRTNDGRLVVHVEDWSHWVGEPTTCNLQVVSEADLGPAGRFAFLGAEAGLGRPLTLDEALTVDTWEEEPTADELDAYEKGFDEGLESGRNLADAALLVDNGLPRRAMHTAA